MKRKIRKEGWKEWKNRTTQKRCKSLMRKMKEKKKEKIMRKKIIFGRFPWNGVTKDVGVVKSQACLLRMSWYCYSRQTRLDERRGQDRGGKIPEVRWAKREREREGGRERERERENGSQYLAWNLEDVKMSWMKKKLKPNKKIKWRSKTKKGKNEKTKEEWVNEWRKEGN